MRILVLSFSVVLLLPAVLFCQTDDLIFESFQFNFATPGARANAMGRAFIGLADDATAAESNPAGLVILNKPEASFEYKNTNFSVDRAIGPNGLIDGTTNDFAGSVNSPAFASFVYPSKQWCFSFFRQEFFNYEESFDLDDRNIPDSPLVLSSENADIDFQGVNYGGALAYRFSTTFSAGVSVKLSGLEVDTRTEQSGFKTHISDTDTGVSWTAGVLINPSRNFSIGAIYEQNPKFEYVETTNVSIIGTVPVTINIPDRFGIGVAFRPSNTLTLIGDIVHVRYSQLVEDFQVIIFRLQVPPRTATEFSMDNGTEVHAGIEKVFSTGNNLVAVRGGLFSNPAHDLNYVGDTTNSGLVADAVFNFGDPETEVGITFGGGVAIRNRFQIDAAYVISGPFNEFSASFVYRFGAS